MGWQTVEIKDKPQRMDGYKIYCYTCAKDVYSKASLPNHIGHEVDWVNKKTGLRFSADR